MADPLSRPLVIGASGLVGGALFAALERAGRSPVGTYNTKPRQGLDHLDLAHGVPQYLQRVHPSCIFLASALTHVDYCESHEQETMERNVEQMRPVVEYCAQHRIPFVFFSTDYVFDGEDGPYAEDAPRNPVNVYGRSKAAGEELVETLDNYAILRITNVFDIGYDEKNFLYRTVTWLRDGKQLVVPSDQLATPTYATWLAEQLISLIGSRKICAGNGIILNVACDEQLSRVEFACKVADLLGADRSLVIGKPTAGLNQAAKRPLRGGLRNDTLKNLLGTRELSVDGALEELLPRMKELYGTRPERGA